jgi:REP element-mobilizing transposase RayT
MIVGYHVIFGAYGFWLPNDPRGSWSDFVGSWELFRFGPATKTDERRSLAHDPHDHGLRNSAKAALKRPPVQFTGLQARAVGRGFATIVDRHRLAVYACSILPEHVHIVFARHSSQVEQIVNWLKGAATRALLSEQLHPFQHMQKPDGTVPKCWSRGEWKVFINSEEQLIQAISYVEENPVKEGKPPQHWSFVTRPV